jgi:hypothetical protein
MDRCAISQTTDTRWRNGVGSSEGDRIRRNRLEILLGFCAKRQFCASLQIISEAESVHEQNYGQNYTWTHNMCAHIMHL